MMAGYAEAVHLLAAWRECRQSYLHFRTDRVKVAAFLDERFGLRANDMRRDWWRQFEAKRDDHVFSSALVKHDVASHDQLSNPSVWT